MGELLDSAGVDNSYGWANMVRDHNMDLPDFYKYLAMLVELTDLGVKVGQDGILSK